jgi:hypothetical protein
VASRQVKKLCGFARRVGTNRQPLYVYLVEIEAPVYASGMRSGKSPLGVDIFQAKEYDAVHKELKSARQG